MEQRKLVAGMLYVSGSFALMAAFIYDYADFYRDAFSVAVALSNSTAYHLLSINVVIAIAVALWMTAVRGFFGRPTRREASQMSMTLPLYAFECILAPLQMNLLMMHNRLPVLLVVVLTLVLRLLHKLASVRVRDMEHAEERLHRLGRVWGVIGFLSAANVVDVVVLVSVWGLPASENFPLTYKHTLMLTYGQMFVQCLRTGLTLSFMMAFPQSPHTYVVETALSLLESGSFIAGFCLVAGEGEIPFSMMRQCAAHVVNVQQAVRSALQRFRLRRAVDMVPPAGPEDVARDSRCTICYDEMQPGSGTKRLPCSHCYHTDCLMRWLEENRTCPYCRADVTRPAAPPVPPPPARHPEREREDPEAAVANIPEDEIRAAYEEFLRARQPQQAAAAPEAQQPQQPQEQAPQQAPQPPAPEQPAQDPTAPAAAAVPSSPSPPTPTPPPAAVPADTTRPSPEEQASTRMADVVAAAAARRLANAAARTVPEDPIPADPTPTAAIAPAPASTTPTPAPTAKEVAQQHRERRLREALRKYRQRLEEITREYEAEVEAVMAENTE